MNAAGHRCGDDVELYKERVQGLSRGFVVTVSPPA